jgi:hypothetical protein
MCSIQRGENFVIEVSRHELSDTTDMPGNATYHPPRDLKITEYADPSTNATKTTRCLEQCIAVPLQALKNRSVWLVYPRECSLPNSMSDFGDIG